MRISIIACRVLNRELSLLAAKSDNIVDLHWLPQGLHDTPSKLNSRLTAKLNEIYTDIENKSIKHRPDYIVLGYGLCSNGIIGLKSKDIPIVVPRTDDCIALLLGSQKRYMTEFEKNPGTYWLSSGWIEACGTLVDSDRLKQARWQTYADKFGEEEADYLIDMEDGWIANYSTCGYISFPEINNEVYRRQALSVAAGNAWQYKELDGNMRMLEIMVNGDWNDDEFLVCPPHHRIVPDYSGRKIKAVPLEENI